MFNNNYLKIKIELLKVILLLMLIMSFTGILGEARDFKVIKFYNESIGEEIEVVADEVVVKFKEGVSSEEIEVFSESLNLTETDVISQLRLHGFKISQGVNLSDVLRQCQDYSIVEYVEPNGIWYFDNIPNDSDYNKQYAHQKIESEAAWDIETGNSEVIIAVIDSGVDYNHEDLRDNCVTGWDFLEEDFTPLDVDGHGTHVAGIAAASGNNSIGITGVSWNSKIMPLKVSNEGGPIFPVIPEAIIYAADQGARVINMSISTSEDYNEVEDAVRYAYNDGVVIVAAVGNQSGPVRYPAAYDWYVLGVAATDENDNRRASSNYGPEVDVAAPGENIFSTLPTYNGLTKLDHFSG